MLRHRVFFSRSRASCVCAAGLVTMSCSGPMPSAQPNSPLPLAPSSILATDPDRSLPAASRGETLFSLGNGTFEITTEAGDTLTGIVFGNLAVPVPGRATLSIGLLVTGGTRRFSGASGVLTGDGRGDFDIGKEGSVTVSSVAGTLQTDAQPAGFRFQMTIGGTSTMECGPSMKIQLAIRGDGSIATVGRARIRLTAAIDNTTCLS